MSASINLSQAVKWCADASVSAAYAEERSDNELRLDDIKSAIGDIHKAREEINKAELFLSRLAARRTPNSELKWPAGCQDERSCARHRECMYFGCRHQGHSISERVVALEREAMEQNDATNNHS